VAFLKLEEVVAKKNAKKPDERHHSVIPDVAVEIDGETFRLCFDMAALRLAKAQLRAAGVRINILRSLNWEDLDVDSVPELFFAAALRYQPTLTWARAIEVANLKNAAGIFGGLAAAYTAAMAEPDENPPQATAQS
jgi:hypothetical protein